MGSAAIGEHIRKMLEDWEREEGPGTLQRALSDLTKGKLGNSPFPRQRIDRLKWEIDHCLAALGCEVKAPQHCHPLKQRMAYSRLAMLLKSADDPDWRFFAGDVAGKGVRIGVGVDLPRTPAVFPPKTKWRLKIKEGDPEPAWRDNYVSTEGREEWMEKHFQAQVEKGMVVLME